MKKKKEERTPYNNKALDHHKMLGLAIDSHETNWCILLYYFYQCSFVPSTKT